MIASLPAEAEWVGLLFYDDQGQLLSATGLMRRRPGEAVDRLHQVLFEDATRVVLITLDDPHLAPLIAQLPDAEATLLDTRLNAAGPRDPLLPLNAAWGGSTDREPPELAPTAPPEVTAAWLPRCPRLLPADPDPEVRVGTNSGLYCGATLRQVDCDLVGDLSGCLGQPLPQLRLDGRGQLDPEGLGDHCREVTPRAGAILSFTCMDGREQADVYGPPIPDRFQVDRISVWPVADPSARPGPINRPLVGTLTSMISAANCPGSPLVVLRKLRGVTACVDGPSLAFVDPRSLSVTATVAVSDRCLEFLVPDPAGPGFLGASSHPLSVTSYDCSGRPGPSWQAPGDDVDGLEVSGVTLARPETAAAETDLILGTVTPGIDPGALFVFDTTRRSYTQRHEVKDGGWILSVAAVGPNFLALGIRGHADDIGIHVHFTEYLGANPQWTRIAPGPTVLGKAPHFLTALDGRVVVSSGPGANSGRPALRTIELTASGPTYQDDSADWALHGTVTSGIRWPSSPYLLLPTTAEPDPASGPVPPRTIVGLFDPADQHFLPGRAELGYGPVSAATVDHEGAVWMALTWSGELVRIRDRAQP